MKLTALLENTTKMPMLQTRHGLSLYLETASHRIVFDFGPDDAFLTNAQALDIDLAAADLAFLSHGHYDHGGGLSFFLSVNDHAPVYVHENAFLPHKSARGDSLRDIGIDPSLQGSPRLRLTAGITRLEDGLTLISGAPGHRFAATSNANLLTQLTNGTLIPDDFSHEQSLIVEEGNSCLLIAGCAHSGIVNILEQAQAVAGRPITHVVAGFHLYQPSQGISEPEENVRAIAHALEHSSAQYLTCHCTGIPSYHILKQTLGNRISYLSAGMQLLIS